MKMAERFKILFRKTEYILFWFCFVFHTFGLAVVSPILLLANVLKRGVHSDTNNFMNRSYGKFHKWYLAIEDNVTLNSDHSRCKYNEKGMCRAERDYYDIVGYKDMVHEFTIKTKKCSCPNNCFKCPLYIEAMNRDV